MPTLPRPDPSRGVLETLLVLDGRPVELDPHLERLAASLETLFGAGLPGEARELCRRRAAGLGLARLRLTVVPAAGGLACEATSEEVEAATPFPGRAGGAELRGLVVAGGLGRHKWADRDPRLAGSGPTVPLLCEADGEVLEAGWANLFLLRGGVLSTPPADGRILPGVTRAAAIAIARGSGVDVRERRLRRGDLFEAEEVFLTASVRGVVPARGLDGEELAADGDLSRAIAAGLRRRWGLRPAPAGAPEPAAATPLGQPAR